MPSDSIDALPRTTSDLVALHADSNHSCTWRRAPWINCSAIAVESVPHPVWVFSPVCSGVGFVTSRCGAVGSRTADFMCRSILRSDWSLSVSDCDLIYSELALLTIKYLYPSWTSHSEPSLRPLQAQA